MKPARRDEEINELVKTPEYLDALLREAESMKTLEKESEKYTERKQDVLKYFKTRSTKYKEFIEEYNFSVDEEEHVDQLSLEVDLQQVTEHSPKPLKIYAANQYLEDVKEIGNRISRLFDDLNEQEASQQIKKHLEEIENILN
jgi:arylsulfatase A-like enzyme